MSSAESRSSDESSYDAGSSTPELYVDTRKGLKTGAGNLNEEAEVAPNGIGLLPDEVYDRALSWWRAGTRRYLKKSLVWESQVIAAMQVNVVQCVEQAPRRR